jgi:hypothetical protein
MRKGRLDLNEQKYIKDNIKNMSYENISTVLDRDPKSILEWIKQNIGVNASDRREVEALNELKQKAYWYDLEGQFTQDELEMFLFHWKKMWSQFKDDVFHTEEIQIVDTIKLEILMNRCLKSQNDNIRQVSELEKIKIEDSQRISFLSPQDKEEVYRSLANIDRQIAVLIATREALSRDFKDLQTKKSSMIKDLKGTREQRIKAIEDSKQTFSALIKKIILDSDFRHDTGIEMEKMRLAMDKERERLSQTHKYEDNSSDQPFLTPETVEG